MIAVHGRGNIAAFLCFLEDSNNVGYQNQDLTQDYFYSDKRGMRLVLPNGNSGFGRFTIQ